MKTNEFTHLHVHTDASLLDGLSAVENTIKHAKNLGFEALGMTDHGNVSNALRFLEGCKKSGIKPVLGMEGYVEVSGDRFHITLLADGNKGFNNIVSLNNLGVEKTNSTRPTFSISDFKKYNEGVYLLTGCPESPMQTASYSDSLSNFSYLKNIFKDRLFIEMMLVNYNTPYERAIRLHKDTGTPIVLTNDVHFPKKEQKDLHTRLLKMRAGGFSYNSEHLFLATPQELLDRVNIEFDREDITPFVLDGMKNAKKLSESLDVVSFNNNPTLPHIPNANKKLWQLVQDGFENRLSKGQVQDNKEYHNRLQREFKTISDMDFSSYFVILHDIVNYAHKQNVWVGKGRGSGAGSLILYVMGITEVDPLKHNLYFERFLNEKRLDMPDVDLDFEKERRDIVLNYATEKWEAKPVATYGTYSHKSALIDLRKSYRGDKELFREAGDFGVESEQFKQICKIYPDFFDMYETILGQTKYLGKHAGGVVISDDNAVLPLTKTRDGGNVIAWTEGENRELSSVGLVKFDLLGLSAGSVLRRLQDKLGITPPEPTDNHEVFEIFREGNTNGIFQFGSDGIIEFLKAVEANTFDDLVAVNALYRTGPLASGAAYLYPDRKKLGVPRNLHRDIDHILKETWGVIVYQEQVMAIYAYLIDGDLSDADLARKVLSKSGKLLSDPNADKKLLSQFKKLKDSFYKGAKNKGWTTQETDLVWGEIETHSGYSFNKSHSTAYAMLAWDLAWFKYYYPVDFYTEYLNVEKSKPDKVESVTFEAVLNGIEVVNPNINISTDEYTCDANERKIYLPITSIKYMSDSSYQKLLDYRPFRNVQDYVERVPKSVIKKRGREGLCALGAFDDIVEPNENPYELLEVEDTSSLKKHVKQDKYLGYMLPTKKYLEAIKESKKFGLKVGVINEVETRNKGRGDYQVVKMSPEGLFWHKRTNNDGTLYKFEVGEIVAFSNGEKAILKDVFSVEI